jgi:Domain of unknown function (DUF4277)
MNPPQGPGFATAYQSKTLDHLGLVAGMCQELELAKIIDEQIPSYASDKVVSHGQATVAMILNGLGFINKALYMVPKFFEDKPADRLPGQGIAPDHLNDDALGRTLEALYTYGVTPLFSWSSQHAAGMLGLSRKAAHLDSTSFHVDGLYNHANPPIKDCEGGGVKTHTKGMMSLPYFPCGRRGSRSSASRTACRCSAVISRATAPSIRLRSNAFSTSTQSGQSHLPTPLHSSSCQFLAQIRG